MIYEARPSDFKARLEVVSCFLEHNGKFLLVHRQNNKPQGDTWGMPAGKKENLETPQGAIRRELEEETGFAAKESVLEYFREIYVRYPDFDFIFHVFFLRLKEKPEIRLDPKEHKDFAWVYPDTALRMKLIPNEDLVIKLFYNIQ